MSGKYQFTLKTWLPNGDESVSTIWLRPEPYDRKLSEEDVKYFKRKAAESIEYQCRQIMEQEK